MGGEWRGEVREGVGSRDRWEQGRGAEGSRGEGSRGMGRKGKGRKRKERKGKRKEGKRKERKGMERNGKEQKGTEGNGRERKGKGRKTGGRWKTDTEAVRTGRTFETGGIGQTSRQARGDGHHDTKDRTDSVTGRPAARRADQTPHRQANTPIRRIIINREIRFEL